MHGGRGEIVDVGDNDFGDKVKCSSLLAQRLGVCYTLNRVGNAYLVGSFLILLVWKNWKNIHASLDMCHLYMQLPLYALLPVP